MYTVLQKITSDFHWIIPEVLLVVFFIVLLLADLIFKKNKAENLLPFLSIALLVIFFIAAVVQWKEFMTLGSEPLLLFSGHLKLDATSIYVKAGVAIAAILTYAFTYFLTDYNRSRYGEFYYLLAIITVGLSLLSMSNSWLMLFLSIEIVSIGSYILAIFNFDKKGTEAAVKYSLYGAFCTGMMLFGISILYGLYGHFNFPTSMPPLVEEGILFLVVVALLLSLTGLFFKMSTFPFHIWTPDIYHGAPIPVVAFFSVAPKVVAIIVFYKLVQPILRIDELSEILTLIVSVLAIITMTIGNFSALLQTNTRRLFAYSTLGHAGFLMMTVVSLPGLALPALLFYSTVYLFMNFTAFGMVDVFANANQSFDVNNFKGLGLKMPFAGLIFVITMIALTGLPPTAGFYAKLFVFAALWETYQVSGQLLFLILLVVGLLNTVVSLFYYLKIPYFLYFKKAESDVILTSPSIPTYLFLTLISLPLIILFFNPNWVLNVLKYIHL